MRKITMAFMMAMTLTTGVAMAAGIENMKSGDGMDKKMTVPKMATEMDQEGMNEKTEEKGMMDDAGTMDAGEMSDEASMGMDDMKKKKTSAESDKMEKGADDSSMKKGHAGSMK
jgi:hypothetical protein